MSVKMKKYEFKYVSFRDDKIDDIIKNLNDLGMEGWSLVTERWIDNYTVTYLLQRPLENIANTTVLLG